ncbi:MAG: tRNA-specific adenosine deaminase, partial [Victivallales bacterium]|nr:tRNA-specific adenosine deaminase [Victivallales bacterium]
AKGDWRLDDCTLFVTKEPCAMCAGAMVNARLGKLVFACPDPRMGAAGSALDITGFSGMLHQVEVQSGLLEDEAREILQAFFRQRRQDKNA